VVKECELILDCPEPTAFNLLSCGCTLPQNKTQPTVTIVVPIKQDDDSVVCIMSMCDDGSKRNPKDCSCPSDKISKIVDKVITPTKNDTVLVEIPKNEGGAVVCI
jgi:hypothetical protein